MGLVILELEDIYNRELFDFWKNFFKWANLTNFNVLVLLWGIKNKDEIEKFKELIKNYFKDLGANKTEFLDDKYDKIEEKFKEFDIIYLADGDTKILLEKLNNNSKILEELKKFDRILIGNGAGAIALSKEGYEHKEEIIKYKGLEIVNTKILTYVKPESLEKINDKDIILFDIGDYVVIKK